MTWFQRFACISLIFSMTSCSVPAAAEPQTGPVADTETESVSDTVTDSSEVSGADTVPDEETDFAAGETESSFDPDEADKGELPEETSSCEADSEPVTDTDTGTQTENASEDPENPAVAGYVPSLVVTNRSITGTLPVIRVDTENRPVRALEEDGWIILPDLRGMHESILATSDFGGLKVSVIYDWYPLPEGVIYGAAFIGEITSDSYRVYAGSQLTLYVSRGINPANVQVGNNDRTVYLTFDDGPNAKNTLAILDTLDRYGIKATFFMVGAYVRMYPDIVREVYSRGHKIGCHTYSHEYSYIYADAANMEAEVAAWEQAVEAAIGFVPPERLFRYPGGSKIAKNPAVLDLLLKRGYRGYDWNALNNDCLLHTRPAGMSAAEYLKESLISTLDYSFRLKGYPHIVLMHDTYTQTAEMLGWAIEYMMSKGCTFATLDKLQSGWYY